MMVFLMVIFMVNILKRSYDDNSVDVLNTCKFCVFIKICPLKLIYSNIENKWKVSNEKCHC